MKVRQGDSAGTRAMIGLLELGAEHGWPRLRSAVEEALELGSRDAEAVRHLLASVMAEPPGMLPKVVRNEIHQNLENASANLPVMAQSGHGMQSFLRVSGTTSPATYQRVRRAGAPSKIADGGFQRSPRGYRRQAPAPNCDSKPKQLQFVSVTHFNATLPQIYPGATSFVFLDRGGGTPKS